MSNTVSLNVNASTTKSKEHTQEEEQESNSSNEEFEKYLRVTFKFTMKRKFRTDRLNKANQVNVNGQGLSTLRVFFHYEMWLLRNLFKHRLFWLASVNLNKCC